jgi:hypothetical protein
LGEGRGGDGRVGAARGAAAAVAGGEAGREEERRGVDKKRRGCVVF